MTILLRAAWVVFCAVVVALLWLALTVYPTIWLGLPWWATMALAAFWLWQMDKAKGDALKLFTRGDMIIRDYGP